MSWHDWKILLELQVIVVVLVDLSGGVDSLKGVLARWLGIRGEIRLKPLDCSLCMYHWTALAVMLCLGRLTLLTYAAICLLAVATMVTKAALCAILDTFLSLFDWRWRRH